MHLVPEAESGLANERLEMAVREDIDGVSARAQRAADRHERVDIPRAAGRQDEHVHAPEDTRCVPP